MVGAWGFRDGAWLREAVALGRCSLSEGTELGEEVVTWVDGEAIGSCAREDLRRPTNGGVSVRRVASLTSAC